jgi:hypothetical protein
MTLGTGAGMISVDAVIKVFAITTRVAIAMALATAALLFTPVPQWLGIPLTGRYRIGAAVLFVVSIAVLIAAGVMKVWELWTAHRRDNRVWENDERRRRRQWRREHEGRIAILNGMMNPERTVCTEFILGDHRTVFLKPSGAVSTLVAQGVLQRLGELTTNELGEIGANFMMEDWAWEHLREHRELVAMRPPGQ